MKNFLILSFALILGMMSSATAQTAEALKPVVVVGDVTSLGSGKIAIQSKDGALDIALSDKTQYKRVSPENPSLSAAAAAALSDIGAGDKLAVSGFYTDDKKTLRARSVYIMTKADLSQKQNKDSEQWRTRGITGKVVAVNPQTNQISVEVRGIAAATNLTLTPKANAKFMRYAPDSVKYSEAKTSSLTEVKPGDMLRALGDKSADGTTFAAEEVLTGAFQTIAGTVKTIDAAKGEVVISDIATKKDITVSVGTATTLKRFPAEMAQRMAQFQAMRADGGVRPGGGQMGARPAGGAVPATGEQGQGRGFGGGGGMRGGQGNIDDMLERFPTITVADLKAGDVIAVSSTKTGVSNRITAIKLLAGVEPFITSQQAAGGRGGRGGQGGNSGFSIPGLDGFDAP